ncbi:MAG: DUF1385 domain-containing protein [bacterium]
MDAKPEGPINVGGQAVMEGVMMRSPGSLAVVCRSATGELVVKEQEWRSIWERLRFLRWPLLRGSVVLIESLVNGMSALSFSAKIQMAGEQDRDPESPAADGPDAAKSPPDLSQVEERAPSMVGVILVSTVLALTLFVGVPHALTALLGFSSASLGFHLIDGVIKATIFVGYIAAIGLMDDIKRVFMYHGAEHKAIYAYESGAGMTVENARRQSRYHPRCGTSFLFIVILISILLFAVALRFTIFDNRILDHVAKVFIKIPLLFPVAGISYEVLKLSARFQKNLVVRALIAPGIWLQRITTREPTDDQLEVALLAIEKTLWREQLDPEEPAPKRDIEVFPSFDEARAVLG